MAGTRGAGGFDELYKLAGGGTTGIGALETLSRERQRGTWEGFGMPIGGEAATKSAVAATAEPVGSGAAAPTDTAMRIAQGVRLLKLLAAHEKLSLRALAEAGGLPSRLAAELIQSAERAGLIALDRTGEGTFARLTDTGRRNIENL